MISTHHSIALGGRYELGDGRQLIWPDQDISLPPDLEHWNCVMTCPSIEEKELSRGHTSRILLKIVCDQPFEFYLTNFQVELGTTPTEFEYNGALSFRNRLDMYRDKINRLRGKGAENLDEMVPHSSASSGQHV